MVATRRRAKEESTKVGGMMEMVQESGCVTSILDFLSLVDFYQFSLCNKKLHNLCKYDQRLCFAQTYSKSWWSWFDCLEEREFADDYAFKKLRRGGLDEDFASLFARNETHMLESIVAWCGGWDAFLRARNHGAKPAIIGAPVAGASTTVVRAGDGNKVHNLCKPVVIFDIHRDNKWQWTALHPLCKDDLRTIAGITDDNRNNGVFYPLSSGTKTLGDPTCAGTAFPWDHGRHPGRYLLSTNPSDTQTYRVSVSIVSPNFAETFVVSADIVPAEICADENINWKSSQKSYNSWVARDKSFRANSKLSMSGGVYQGHYFGRERQNFGKKANDVPVHSSPQLRFTYYRDKRSKQERFHLVMEMWWSTTQFYDMWVHPAAKGATHTMWTSRPRKRQL